MTTMKCDQTGHFFGYYPEHDIGFTCFECLEEFGSSGRRPANPYGYSAVGMIRESRKRRSLHLPPPPPPDVPQEPVNVSERDECGRRRSKPWRCLQQRCKLLACDRCAELLVDPDYVSSAKNRDFSELQGKRNSVVGAEATVQAGAATPPEQRASRELRGSTHGPVLARGGALEGAEQVKPPLPEDGTLECDSAESDDEESALDSLRTKLVYRRAGHVATSALAHYHHRENRSGRSSFSNRLPVKEPPPPREEVRRTASAIPDHLLSTGTGNQMVALEVDSKEASDEDDFMPKLTVRSAAQAANQALKSVHWRQRAANMGSACRVERV